MTNSDVTLPTGWKWTTIKEISKEIYRYPTFYGMDHLEQGVPVIRGEHILQNGTVSHDWSDYWFVSQDISNKFPKTIVEVNDLIMSVRGSVGKIGIIDDALINAQVSPNCIRISPKRNLCFPRYLLYYLKSSTGRTSISDNVNATTIQTIKASSLSLTPVPLPPLPEQERIVERIESLFTQLDAGVAGLKRAQAALKRYRASVLKAACEGRLVPQDPNDEPAEELLKHILAEKGEKADKIPVANGNLPELPKGWVWARFDDITQNYDSKRVPVKAGDREKMAGEYPYYGASGIIDYVNDYIFNGDYLLIAEDGANLLSRSTLIAFQAHGRFWVNNHAHVVQTMGGIPLDYLEIYLNSFDLTFHVTGTAQPKLTQKNLNRIPVPIPPHAEQKCIVAEVERRLSVVDDLEQTVFASLKRATRLRQAILKRAFEGRLVEQNPGDEPAEALLERIKGNEKITPKQARLF